MRYIYMDDGLRLRFPARGEEFDQGVEIGVIAALMDMELRSFSRWISAGNVAQARSLAGKLGYTLVEGPSDGEWTEVTLRFGQARPQLKLVHSRS